VHLGIYLLLRTSAGSARHVLVEVEIMSAVESATPITGAFDLVLRLRDGADPHPVVEHCAASLESFVFFHVPPQHTAP
jgi:hypothetical protein